MYYKGDEIAKDYGKAKVLLEKAAYSIDSAAFILGVMHYHGMGTPQSYTEAYKWISKSVKSDTREKGNADAEAYMGSMYYNGHGCTANKLEAMQWFRMSASKGNHYSEHSLGVFYQNDGMVEEAFKWYERAAKSGISPAMLELGKMYYEGTGVAKDLSLSAYWIEKAYNAKESGAKAFWESKELWKYKKE
jgi:TPR repeat protein